MVRESFDIHFIIEKFPAILSALPVTLEITAVTLVLGWLLGLLVAWGKVSGSGWLKKFLRILTDIIRGIPTVVLLYIVYFGLPKLINVSNWSKISFVVLALMIELGTTSSEMFRSGIQFHPERSAGGGLRLGYTGIQKFFHIIIPQGLAIILPNLGSAVLSIIQATALVYTLGIFDILGKARQLDTNVSHVKTFEMYFSVAIIYWALAVLIQFIFSRLEKQMRKESVQ